MGVFASWVFPSKEHPTLTPEKSGQALSAAADRERTPKPQPFPKGKKF